jgi:hypothetical protein
MGLFDNLKFPAKLLPFPKDLKELSDFNWDNIKWQTKDLGRTYNGYFYLKEIDNKYKLYHKRYKYEWDINETRNQFQKAVGLKDGLKKVGEEDIFVSHHGDIRFYNYLSDDNWKNDYWIEFVAIFKEGILDSIKLLEFRVTDNAERKEQHKKLIEKFEKQKAFNKTIRGKITNKFSRIKYKTGYMFINIGNKLLR